MEQIKTAEIHHKVFEVIYTAPSREKEKIKKEPRMYENRTLVRGDNLEEMRRFPDECIDLIATDPPFNSNRNYFVPYRDEHGQEPDTLIRAFTDTWTWGEAAEDAYNHLLVEEGGQIGDTIQGLRQFLSETPMMAYLVMMAIRIVEMHRILKPTGSLYLHCDPSSSHYLKIVLDAVFGNPQFQNEIVWNYHRFSRNSKRRFARMNDIIFFYSKGNENTFNLQYTERKKSKVVEKGWDIVVDSGVKKLLVYDMEKVEQAEIDLDEYEVVETKESRPAMGQVWSDINILNSQSKERTSYPTQKPTDLYKRIVAASSNEGDLVLDPFCGCGTTLVAAEALNRHWIGIDLTYLATGAVKHQIEKFFPHLRNSINIAGTPENEEQALELAHNNPLAFEEWCITHVLKFRSNDRRGADGGIDGTSRFPLGRIQGRQAHGKAVAQVKGGNYTLGHIRDFRTAMQNAEADLGVFVITRPPTQGMLTEASRAGTYTHPSYDLSVPVLQIYEIQEYFRGVLPRLPFGERQVL